MKLKIKTLSFFLAVTLFFLYSPTSTIAISGEDETFSIVEDVGTSVETAAEETIIGVCGFLLT